MSTMALEARQALLYHGILFLQMRRRQLTQVFRSFQDALIPPLPS